MSLFLLRPWRSPSSFGLFVVLMLLGQLTFIILLAQISDRGCAGVQHPHPQEQNTFFPGLQIAGHSRRVVGKARWVPQKPLRVAILSSFPPQLCGIGEFTADLVQGIQAQAGPFSASLELGIIVVDARGTELEYPLEVKLVLRRDSFVDFVDAADFINQNFDVLNVQHEFGLYGGIYGDFLLALLDRVQVPLHLHLHTVDRDPPLHFQLALEAALHAATHVSVIHPALCAELPAPGPPCSHLPHGIPDLPQGPRALPSAHAEMVHGRRLVLSAGLISPGKGLEHMVEAMASVARRVPEALYVILGGQHPLLEGDYLGQLQARAAALECGGCVAFVAAHQSKRNLVRWMAAAEVVVVPYLDALQTSSGTLSMALGLGRAAVATGFRFAEHMCGGGAAAAACVLVPPANASSLSEAVAELLLDPGKRAALEARAWAATRNLTWPRVGARFVDVFRTLAGGSGSGSSPGRKRSAGGSVALEGPIQGWDSGERQRLLAAAAGVAPLREGRFSADAAAEMLHGRLRVGRRPPPELVPGLQALSAGPLLFRGWSPAPAECALRVRPDGGFHLRTPLMLLHGDLARGFVHLSAPEQGLLFGHGVRLSGLFVSFEYMGREVLQRVEGNVADWGHSSRGGGAELWFSTRLLVHNRTRVAEFRTEYRTRPGGMALHITYNLTVSPGMALQNVRIISGMDALSSSNQPFAFDSFVSLDDNGQLERRSGRYQGTMYNKDQLARSPPILQLLATSQGELGIFTFFPPHYSDLLDSVYSHSTRRGQFHYVAHRYGSPFVGRYGLLVEEVKLVALEVQPNLVAEYVTIFQNSSQWRGVDVSGPANARAVTDSLAMYYDHMPSTKDGLVSLFAT